MIQEEYNKIVLGSILFGAFLVGLAFIIYDSLADILDLHYGLVKISTSITALVVLFVIANSLGKISKDIEK